MRSIIPPAFLQLGVFASALPFLIRKQRANGIHRLKLIAPANFRGVSRKPPTLTVQQNAAPGAICNSNSSARWAEVLFCERCPKQCIIRTAADQECFPRSSTESEGYACRTPGTGSADCSLWPRGTMCRSKTRPQECETFSSKPRDIPSVSISSVADGLSHGLPPALKVAEHFAGKSWRLGSEVLMNLWVDVIA